MRMSLKWRISLWYAITTIFVILALVFTGQQVMVVNLKTAVDEHLQYRSEIVARTIVTSVHETRYDAYQLVELLVEKQLQYIPTVLRISDSTGNVLATYGDIPDPMIPILDSQLLLPQLSEGRFETIRIRGQETLRLYTVPVYDPSTSKVIALIQAGDSLSMVVAAQKQLWLSALAIGIVGSLLSILVGLVIFRQGFRPLDKIMSHIREMESKNLRVGIPEEPRPSELQQLANTINNTLHRLDEAFRTREVFVASVSHDLRTPLTALQGQIDVLLMQPPIETELRDSLERMAKEIRRLVRMTNNLLLNAQLESNPAFVPSEVNLKELVDEVIKEAKPMAESLAIKVSARKNIIASGDYDLLKQMILNVVENALKFTAKGGIIRIKLNRENNYAIFAVSDTGAGIPQKYLTHVAEPFYKVDATRKFGSRGVGLGLAIVKQVVDLHGGQLKIHSREKVGTTVTIYLPLASTQR